MKRMILAALAVTTALGAASIADARQGCGRGFHRGPHGRCLVNRVGGFYSGFGYWDGHRYWQHRYRYHNRWRYR